MAHVFLLLASFAIYAINGGSTWPFGVILPDLMAGLGCSMEEAALAGSLQQGVFMGSAIVVGGLVDLFGCHVVSLIGSAIAGVGFILNSFVTDIYQFYITNVLISGIGLGMQFLPVIVAVQRKLPARRRNAAVGIVSSGSGIGTFMFAPLCRLLLDEYGWRGMYLILGALMLNTVPLSMGLRTKPLEAVTEITEHVNEKNINRFQESKTSLVALRIKKYMQGMFEFRLLCDPGFRYLLLSMFAIGLGIQVPYIFLPSKAQFFGISKFNGAILISAVGITDTLGRALMGIVGSYLSTVLLLMVGNICLGTVNIVSMLFVTFPPMLFHAIAYGLLFGNYCIMSMTAGTEILGPEKCAKAAGMVLSVIALTVVITPPVAASLWDSSGNPSAPFLFAGTTSVLSGMTLLVFLIKHRQTIRFWRGRKTALDTVERAEVQVEPKTSSSINC